MADKTVSKHLTNIERQFAATDPILQKTAKIFQELDAIEFDLGLIDNDETTARKTSWWPIVSTLGGYSPAKSDFITRYLGAQLHTSRHKFTVLQYTPQANSATLPGTALDADHRLPFYQISREIELVAPSEAGKLNAYLELVTVNSPKLKGKLVIDAPVLNPAAENPATVLLRKYVIAISDLVLVFNDLFEADAELIKETLGHIIAHQDSNKFVFVIDHSELSLDPLKTQEIAASWQRRLAEMGVHTGQFVVLTQAAETSVFDQRFNNLSHARSYRILNSLENSIREIDDVIMPEVEDALNTWKERSNASTLIILSFIVMLMLFAEIAVGILDFLFDPIIGPAIIAVLIAILTPLHIFISRVHAKFVIKNLQKRQKQLNLTEDLAGLFEKSLGFWRTVAPLTEPVGKNKKTAKKLIALIEQSKELVQALNDQFSSNAQQEYFRNQYDAYPYTDQEDL